MSTLKKMLGRDPNGLEYLAYQIDGAVRLAVATFYATGIGTAEEALKEAEEVLELFLQKIARPMPAEDAKAFRECIADILPELVSRMWDQCEAGASECSQDVAAEGFSFSAN